MSEHTDFSTNFSTDFSHISSDTFLSLELSQDELRQLAEQRADLWEQIPAHPNCYPELANWVYQQRAAYVAEQSARAHASSMQASDTEPADTKMKDSQTRDAQSAQASEPSNADPVAASHFEPQVQDPSALVALTTPKPKSSKGPAHILSIAMFVGAAINVLALAFPLITSFAVGLSFFSLTFGGVPFSAQTVLSIFGHTTEYLIPALALQLLLNGLAFVGVLWIILSAHAVIAAWKLKNAPTQHHLGWAAVACAELTLLLTLFQMALNAIFEIARAAQSYLGSVTSYALLSKGLASTLLSLGTLVFLICTITACYLFIQQRKRARQQA